MLSSNTKISYPFGSSINELTYQHINEGDTAGYSYGFNNQEKDSELGEYYAFEFRIQDARIGRFLSVDPLAPNYPWYSPYQVAGNLPIWAKELEGLEPEITSSVQNSDGSITYTLTDKSSGYSGDVTLDASKGDKIESDNGKIISYQKDWKQYTWDKDDNYYSSGEIQTFKGVTCKTTRDVPLYIKFRRMEYEWSSPNGSQSPYLQSRFNLVTYSPIKSLSYLFYCHFHCKIILKCLLVSRLSCFPNLWSLAWDQIN